MFPARPATCTQSDCAPEPLRDDFRHCAEVATYTRPYRVSAAVRDSKDLEGPVPSFQPDEWTTFTQQVKTGLHDLKPCGYMRAPAGEALALWPGTGVSCRCRRGR
ncbi:DUF397 domain-containing protein [Actinomadura sp. LD22]|uniref:DUF397 domain-containing protein n=1 Tax=Actinomadura physcomitrii TaxID=2650748 RepID=A0A6I4M2L7_9ACTN|nr:DUF397 domain-containing protein [Actinomadura physcomitrii]